MERGRKQDQSNRFSQIQVEADTWITISTECHRSRVTMYKVASLWCFLSPKQGCEHQHDARFFLKAETASNIQIIPLKVEVSKEVLTNSWSELHFNRLWQNKILRTYQIRASKPAGRLFPSYRSHSGMISLKVEVSKKVLTADQNLISTDWQK